MNIRFPFLGLAALLTGVLAQPSPPAASTTTSVAQGTDTLRKFEFPAETGTYRTAPGVELAQTFCLNCHSTEYAEAQPPLPDAYWQATVKKMKEKFGATLPDEAMAPLAKYLIDAYGKKP
jgi:hypothetical protein